MYKTKDTKKKPEKDIVFAWIKHDFVQIYVAAGIIAGFFLSGIIFFMAVSGMENITRCFLPQIKEEAALEEYVADAVIEKSEAKLYPEDIWDTGVSAGNEKISERLM